MGTSKPVRVKHLANLIGGKTVSIPDRPGEPRISHANIKRLKKIEVETKS